MQLCIIYYVALTLDTIVQYSKLHIRSNMYGHFIPSIQSCTCLESELVVLHPSLLILPGLRRILAKDVMTGMLVVKLET